MTVHVPVTGWTVAVRVSVTGGIVTVRVPVTVGIVTVRVPVTGGIVTVRVPVTGGVVTGLWRMCDVQRTSPCSWWAGRSRRDGWSSTWTASGALCVTTTGTGMTPRSSADSWVITGVCVCKCVWGRVVCMSLNALLCLF